MQGVKKRLSLLVIALSVALFTYASAAQPVSVVINGKTLVSDAPAVIINGSTMLPFRAVFNALGVSDNQIVWNQRSKSIEVHAGGKYIFLVIGSKGAIVNDKMITLGTAPFVQNGRTFIPVRFVAESLGAEVRWNQSTKTVTIKKK